MRPLLFASTAVVVAGCVAMPDASSMAGRYAADPRADAAMAFRGIDDGRVHTPEIVYSLVLDRGGTFETSRYRTDDGMPLMDSSLHAGGYDPHEVLQGAWHLNADRLVLESRDKRYEARLKHMRDGWRILWDGVEYHRKRN